jgi:hypothetical protein
MDVHRAWCPGAINLVSLAIVDHNSVHTVPQKMMHVVWFVFRDGIWLSGSRDQGPSFLGIHLDQLGRQVHLFEVGSLERPSLVQYSK